MKILNVVKTNYGAMWAFKQAKWLKDRGVDVITVLPSVKDGVAELYNINSMQIIEGDVSLPVKKPYQILRKIIFIRKLIHNIEPDLIHCHFVTNILMMRLALRKSTIPRLFQVPGPLHLENQFYRTIEIKMSNRYDYWAGACNLTCGKYLGSGISKDKVFLAYYGGYGGTECETYLSNLNKLHEEYKIDKKRILVGMVSYFYKPKRYLFQTKGIKGHEDFIDAIALVRAKNPLVFGVIVGDAWDGCTSYVEKIKRYAKRKCGDEILFTGYRSDMKEIYKELDIVIHPSHSENLGGAAESLAAGIPTISTNVGGFPDIVHDKSTGLLVNPGNPLELENSICWMIEHKMEAHKMALKGQKFVRKLLNIDITAAEIFRIYKIILS